MTPTTLAANAAQQGVTDLIARLMDAMPATQDWRSTELCGLLEEAAAALTTLSEQVAELTQERDELRREGKPADRALVDKYRNTKTGIFKFPDDVAAIIRALDAAEAKLARLEAPDAVEALVKAAVAEALDAAAIELDQRGQREQVDYGLGRETQNFYRARDLVRARAVAIRAGGKP